jgi:alpha-tubulin suppressor-like RCC1 family protein
MHFSTRSSIAFTVLLGGGLTLGLSLAGCDETPAMVDAGPAGVDAFMAADAFREPDAAEPVDAFREPDAGEPRCVGKGCEIVQLSLGFATSCARRGNGEVLCWGRGQGGELGDGASRHLPGCVEVGGSTRTDCSENAVVVALPGGAQSLFNQGGFQFCAEVDLQFWCWGSRGYRVTGGMEGDRLRPERTPLYDGARSFADAFTYTCWLDAAGNPSCIGSNGVGQLATGDFMLRTEVVVPLLDMGGTPVPLGGLVEIATSTTFGGHTCARSTDQLYCWGANEVGQLGEDGPHVTCVSGIAEFDCSPFALPIAFARAADITRLSLGSDHSCALLSDGTAWCWGRNRTGELGLGTAARQDVTLRTEPTEITAVTDIAEIELGARHTCARKNDGTVWCWGSNDFGQLGDGMEEHPEDQCMNGTTLVDCSSVPVRVAGIDDAVELEVGRQHSCVIRSDGTVWCWGYNDNYEVTPGSRLPVYTPARVPSL